MEVSGQSARAGSPLPWALKRELSVCLGIKNLHLHSHRTSPGYFLIKFKLTTDFLVLFELIIGDAFGSDSHFSNVKATVTSSGMSPQVKSRSCTH